MPFKGPQPLRRVRCFGTTEIKGLRQGALGAEVPGHRQEQLTQALIMRFFEIELLFVALKIGRARDPLK